MPFAYVRGASESPVLVRQLVGNHAKDGFVEADDWLFPGVGFDGWDIEAAGGGIDPTRAKELTSHAGEVAAIVGVDGIFGSGLRLRCGAGFHFYESQGAAVVADEIDFTFDSGNGVVAGNERVAVATEVPVGEGFAADAGLTRRFLWRSSSRCDSARPLRAAKLTAAKIKRANMMDRWTDYSAGDQIRPPEGGRY